VNRPSAKPDAQSDPSQPPAIACLTGYSVLTFN
jgi:hypothetical protein